MGVPVKWQCPHCNHFVTITDNLRSSDHHFLYTDNALDKLRLTSEFYVCPNPDCNLPTVAVALGSWYRSPAIGSESLGKTIKRWRLYPEGSSRPFPEYIPEAIRNDYREACLIVSDSPKASATLSRRCMQGILRDFWEVKPGRLVDEIKQIADKTDPLTWEAIDAVRNLGNIGAHMGKDIDLIVDVDPGEAEMMIKLIETVLTEWYVARHEREQRMKALTVAAAAKKEPQQLKVNEPEE